MPRLKGEPENTVSEVSVGRPSSKFPPGVFTSGPGKDPKDQCSFHFPERACSWEPDGVMGPWGAWTWTQSRGAGVIQVASCFHTPTHASPPGSPDRQAAGVHQRQRS